MSRSADKDLEHETDLDQQLGEFNVCQKLLKCDKLLNTFNPSMNINDENQWSPREVSYYSLSKGSSHKGKTNTPKFIHESNDFDHKLNSSFMQLREESGNTMYRTINSDS